MKRIMFMVLATTMLFAAMVAPAAAATKSWSYYRGSALLWSRTSVTWTFASNKISNGACSQQCGYIFPCTIRATGVSLYKYSTSHWRYTSNYRAGGGILTPWGDLTFGSVDSADFMHLYGDGSATASHN